MTLKNYAKLYLVEFLGSKILRKELTNLSSSKVLSLLLVEPIVTKFESILNQTVVQQVILIIISMLVASISMFTIIHDWLRLWTVTKFLTNRERRRFESNLYQLAKPVSHTRTNSSKKFVLDSFSLYSGTRGSDPNCKAQGTAKWSVRVRLYPWFTPDAPAHTFSPPAYAHLVQSPARVVVI